MKSYTVTRIIKEVYEVLGTSKEDVMTWKENPVRVEIIEETVNLTDQQILPAIIQSAFEFDNGRRIIIYTGATGIKSFECDKDWKPFEEPFASSPLSWLQKSPLDFHLTARNELHPKEHFRPEHSTVLRTYTKKD